MKGENLGEFEELVMLTIGVLDNQSFGLAIKKELEERLNRRVSLGALHASLRRLWHKGYLESWLGEATRERGGKRKRYFKVTLEGQMALRRMMENRKMLWASISELAFDWDKLKGE